MANLTHHQIDLNNATWIDVNTCFGQNNLPERLPDEQSVLYCSLYNLLNCPVGDRGGLFEPEYGSDLYYFLQEPCTTTTAQSIRTSILATLGKWEPRIRLDPTNTTVTPMPSEDGYYVRISGWYLETQEYDSINVFLSRA